MTIFSFCCGDLDQCFKTFYSNGTKHWRNETPRNRGSRCQICNYYFIIMYCPGLLLNKAWCKSNLWFPQKIGRPPKWNYIFFSKVRIMISHFHIWKCRFFLSLYYALSLQSKLMIFFQTLAHGLLPIHN